METIELANFIHVVIYSFDFHDLVKGRFSDVYSFMSRRICRSLHVTIPNCYSSPTMCYSTWSWYIQGQIPHNLTLLWEIQVDAQILQHAAYKNMSLSTEYSTALLSFRYPSYRFKLTPNLQCVFYSTWLACTHYKSTAFPYDRDMALLLVYL